MQDCAAIFFVFCLTALCPALQAQTVPGSFKLEASTPGESTPVESTPDPSTPDPSTPDPFTLNPSEPTQTDSFTVVVFLHTECVISRYYTATLREIYQDFHQRGVNFFAVFPDPSLQQSDIDAFSVKFSLPFKGQSDPNLAWTHALNARITPEVFLLQDGEQVLYRGRIDDAYFKIGGKRPEARTRDLRDALQLAVNGIEFEPRRTEAIGCFIQGADFSGSPN